MNVKLHITKRNTVLYALFLGLFSSLFFSCKGGSNTFNSASGSPGELLLVMDEDLLSSISGEIVKEMLQEEVTALPQIEPWMKVQTVATHNFEDFLRNTRNIVIVQNDGAIYSHNAVKYSYDEWAKGQLVIVIQVPSKDSLKTLAEHKGGMVRNLLLRHELYRYAELWKKSFSTKADSYSKELFGYHINLPEDIQSYKKGENFLWLSNNAYSKRTDVVIYKHPYNGGEDFSKERLLQIRDSVLGKNIPGATPDSYMTTTEGSTKHRLIKMPNGTIIRELKGLWETSGSSAMAGPFVAHVLTVPEEKAMYYIEGFVYHPNENKRELIRRIQATLFSFRPVSQEAFDIEAIKGIWWSEAE
ncbi:DUF4837 family protein [Porphyromonas circumdentaria]|uniref:DUF4837 domain-containing protein n=1 Tax=Porphyromonas circumdentaria TaxID=29524 RepID=A0A1T4LEF2_9PORP|nr:DUF4837 family protein [Porphyromonas circumdentaria]MBB6275288.1 hypothetical protein [Porphyromonas circumdentaria]SJZ53115.1 protein of unknown function [Porphyromonas circumdentaria]